MLQKLLNLDHFPKSLFYKGKGNHCWLCAMCAEVAGSPVTTPLPLSRPERTALPRRNERNQSALPTSPRHLLPSVPQQGRAALPESHARPRGPALPPNNRVLQHMPCRKTTVLRQREGLLRTEDTHTVYLTVGKFTRKQQTSCCGCGTEVVLY